MARGSSAAALAVTLLYAGVAQAQAAQDDLTQADEQIIVTGSRIERAGFDAPTPTTVIGALELNQGDPPNLQQVLNDSPAFRPSNSPQVGVGNASSAGTAGTPSLRNIGSSLTLVNGRRSVISSNLNFIPMGIVDHIETVTGGASAAYGSDATAGVVNILFKRKVQGLTVGATAGISSRADGQRLGADVTWGTGFAEDRGQIMVAADWQKDSSIPDRNSRPRLASAGIVPVNPSDPADRRQIMVADVNWGNQVPSGLITSGVLAGQMFNEDGTLRAFRSGTPTATPRPGQFPTNVVGGADAVGTYDGIAVTTPSNRIATYAHATYEVADGVTLWADASYGQVRSNYPFLPNILAPVPLTISANNAFLSQDIRDQLSAAGETSFTLGKYWNGPFMLNLSTRRQSYEGAIGFDATLFGSWTAHGYYNHGETRSRERIVTPITARFNDAINAVQGANGPVCAVNADASSANDDAACVPVNLFGVWNASPEAMTYINGVQGGDSISKIDSAELSFQGDLFRLWARQPITVVFGASGRWQSQQQTPASSDDIAGIFMPSLYSTFTVGGKYNVKEAFAEVGVPLLELEGKIKLDLNGAARYADYSRAGGTWVWKGGATIRLFDQILLRGVRSRDFRAPSISSLFSVETINVRPMIDLDTAGRQGIVGYNPAPNFVEYHTGGNPDLKSVISHTTSFGATFSPKFLPGFNASVDWYKIVISNETGTLSGQNLTLACSLGFTAACAQVVRDPTTQTVIRVYANSQNLSKVKSQGIDMEASYRLPLSHLSASLPGTLSLRGLATYVKYTTTDNGISVTNNIGEIAGGTSGGVPHWRANFSANYAGKIIDLGARLRYIGKGIYNRTLIETLVNNKVPAFTYLDMNISFKINDRFTIGANMNNVFDKQPPLSEAGPNYYDAIGRYMSVTARARF
ncbi:TonB-dependent receptor plug domain-containing protein [Sphingomonas quercus]|uniref:TonB-dependent receptor n=1 Tax=Sphingomonas quercus TaxID=2842451 RepID=A0ABS6BDP3_9SPHN|nr:TonB-dependent receptor [Sphingomonas quercus]MBU3076441.1 TonB-dependent receptor [Sphingomonas quercus]